MKKLIKQKWCLAKIFDLTIKRSHWMLSQGCTANDPSIRFEPMCESSHCLLLFVFRISPKTLGKVIVVFHSELTVLWWSIGTVATWPVLQKKQVTICFKVIFPRKSFVWNAKRFRQTFFNICATIYRIFMLLKVVNE